MARTTFCGGLRGTMRLLLIEDDTRSRTPRPEGFAADSGRDRRSEVVA
jgi:hypothetical protein